MHFAFTSEQRQFGEAVHQVLSKECTPSDVRAAFAAPRARSGRWATLAEMGVVGLCLPEADGGLGLGLLDLVLVLEETGRVALPEPLAATAALAGPLLAEVPSPDRTAALREAIASGQVVACVAEVIVAGTVAAPRPRVSRSPGPTALICSSWPPRWTTVGRSMRCRPNGRRSPRSHRSIPPGSSASRDGRRPPTPASPRGQPLRPPSPAPPIEVPWPPLPNSSGLADRMIGMTADYAKARHQFGKPIGSFQAVKHHAGRGPGRSWSSPDRRSMPPPGPLTRASPPHLEPLRPPRLWPRRRPPRPPGWPSRCTAPSATPGNAICTSSSSGPGPWLRPGVRPADHRRGRARLLDRVGLTGRRSDDLGGGRRRGIRERRRRRWASRCIASTRRGDTGR